MLSNYCYTFTNYALEKSSRLASAKEKKEEGEGDGDGRLVRVKIFLL